MRQGNPLKQIRGTINLVIPTGDGNPKINVIIILGISLEDLNLFTISAYFLLWFCMQLWAPRLLNQFMPKRMLKIRGLFMHVALCEIVVKILYRFLQMIQRIEWSLHIFDVPIDVVWEDNLQGLNLKNQNQLKTCLR